MAGIAVLAAVFVIGYLLAAGPAPAPAAGSHLTGSRGCSPGLAGECGSASAVPPPTSMSPSATVNGRPSTTPAGSSITSPRAALASSPPASSGQPSAAGAAAASVLAVINQARAQAGLPAYTILTGLQASSAQHNLLMASGCGLSHQCPGEPALGERETAAGVHWTAAGENIGEGGPVADTTAAITQMAVTLTSDMLAEQPPDDGHRLNILSSSFTRVGIAVYRDGNGTVWMTQDFSN
jgi:uncharacterized protein YkwD